MSEPVNIEAIMARVRQKLVHSAEVLADQHGVPDGETVVEIDYLTGPTWTGSGVRGSKVEIQFAVKLRQWCPR